LLTVVMNPGPIMRMRGLFPVFSTKTRNVADIDFLPFSEFLTNSSLLASKLLLSYHIQGLYLGIVCYQWFRPTVLYVVC
jgi:hypothetical protein